MDDGGSEKRRSVLKTVAGHPWEFVGWTLFLGYAINTLRGGYTPPRAGQAARKPPRGMKSQPGQMYQAPRRIPALARGRPSSI